MSDVIENLLTIQQCLEYIHKRHFDVSYDMLLNHIKTLGIYSKVGTNYLVSKDNIEKLLSGELYTKKYIVLKKINV